MQKTAKPFCDIPGPPKLPFVGNVHLYKLAYLGLTDNIKFPGKEVLKLCSADPQDISRGIYNLFRYHKVLQHLYKTYGPLVRQYLGQRAVIHVFDPNDIQIVYRQEGNSPHVAPLLSTAKSYREAHNMSLGLGNTNGEEWYRMRSAIRKMMLRPNEVHYYIPFIQEVSRHFVERLEQKQNDQGQVNNLDREVAKWSMESAGLVCFEERLGCMSGGQTEEESEKMIEANRSIFELSAILKFSLPFYKYTTTPKLKRLIAAEDFFYSNALKHIKKTIGKVEKTLQEGNVVNGKYNFMSYLLSRQELSNKDVLIITFSLFADGLSTTVPVLLYNLYCLATHTELQEQVHKEIEKVCGGNDCLSVDMLNNLVLLKATVKESFRMFPNGTEVSRILQQDLVLSGYEIPAGTHVDLCPSVHFQSEEYFVNPKSFQPERWLRNNKQIQVHPYLLTPFGHGTRTCAGRRFAEQDLYVVLCCILQKFKLQYVGLDPLQQIYNTLLFPAGDVKIQFMPRK